MTDFRKYFPDGLLIGQPISLADCRVLRPYLLERAHVTSGSVVMIAVPYAVRCHDRTVSMYAVAKDYHAYFSALFNKTAGTNLNEYVNRVRIRKVLEMRKVWEKRYTLKEIVSRCGFNSMETYYRVLKKYKTDSGSGDYKITVNDGLKNSKESICMEMKR